VELPQPGPIEELDGSRAHPLDVGEHDAEPASRRCVGACTRKRQLRAADWLAAFGRLKALKSSAYAGLMSAKSLSLFRNGTVGAGSAPAFTLVEEAARERVHVGQSADAVPSDFSPRPSDAEVGERGGDAAGRGKHEELTGRRPPNSAARLRGLGGVFVRGAGRVGVPAVLRTPPDQSCNDSGAQRR
jgi:hypothetical protein